MPNSCVQNGLKCEWGVEHKDGSNRLICRQVSIKVSPGYWYQLLKLYHQYRVEYVYSHAKGRDWTIPDKYRTGENPPTKLIPMLFELIKLGIGGKKWRKHCKQESNNRR